MWVAEKADERTARLVDDLVALKVASWELLWVRRMAEAKDSPRAVELVKMMAELAVSH
jgi:hypothetical protein